MSPLDVLIVTAVAEEYAAVIAAGGGEAAWDQRDGLRVRGFEVEGGSLTIGVTQALVMGAAGAVAAAAAEGLLKDPGVRCLAMCGVCAGKRDDVALGDVIIADRVWQYDTGKDKGGRVEGDIEMFRLHPPAWKQAAERFKVDALAPWLAERPRSYEAQGDWVLERVLRGVDPMDDPQCEALCADWEKVLARLRGAGLMRKGARTLTAKGRAHIERVLEGNRGKLPKLKALRVHVGPIASGSMVKADGKVFARLAPAMRKAIGVEMEAASVGMLGWAKQVEAAVVVKAVMDHADADKSDNFKGFAARASAEVLLAFVKRNLPPRSGGEDRILSPGTSALPTLAGPAALLNARHEVVPFHGRADVLAELRAWCEGEGGGAKVRLIHAAGGMGKTRLGIELCRRMREASGWRAGFLREGAKVDEVIDEDRAALVEIDYAESRVGLGDVLAKVAAARGRKKALRVLLLARNADAWWADVMRADGAVKDLLCEEEGIELRAVTPDPVTIFGEAVAAFAQVKGKQAPKVEAPSFEDKRYGRVLYVHAAALAAVEGRDVKINALMEDTLDHEERFWRAKIERENIDDMRQVVAGLTLTGGAESKAALRTLVVAIRGEADPKMAMLLRDVYPGREQKYVGGLEPDLLGEAMVQRALSGEGGGAEAYLRRVFEGASAEAIRTGFTVLGRLSEDHEDATAWIAQVLARDVAGRAMEAFAAAKIVGERTAHSPLGMVLAKALEKEGTIALAVRLEKVLPRSQQTVSLREVGRWVMAKQLAHLSEEDEEERARLLHGLGDWQDELGQREAALASTQEAVAIRRKLAQARPEAFLPDLATSLNNLGGMQSALGQREAALASTQEAADTYRKLAQARPEAFLPDLATSLNNLGAMQSALGQREAALASSQEAVDIRRKLALARPEAFRPALAGSLNNLGMMQSALGQCEAALASTQEAVDTYRKLAQAQPEAFLPDLAMSLNNLGVDLRDHGRPEAALACAQEALDALWPFYLRLPAAFADRIDNYLHALRLRLAALHLPPTPDLLAREAHVRAPMFDRLWDFDFDPDPAQD
jgi:nucleoside phosphorylase/tetratricopeptide (TPR) repeat protein